MADDDTEDQDPAATAAESEIDAGAQAPPPRDPTPPTMSELMTGTPHSEDLHSEEEYQAQLENQHKTQVFNDNKHYLEQQQRIQYIQQQMQDLANTPQPQMLQQRSPPTNEEKTSATQNVLQLLAIAGIAFSVFGARRNSYSQGALMGGMGALLQGYAQGRTDRQKEQKEALINWHKLNEDIQKENQERRQEYERILSNKKLNLEEQFKLAEYTGKFYNSSRMVTNAQNKQLDKMHQHIKDMKKAEMTHSANTIYGTKEDNARYHALVKEYSGLDLDTPQGADWALHNYPFSMYLKQSKSETRYNDEGKVVGRSEGGFTGPAPVKAPKTNLDKAMDQKFGAVKPKAKSSTTPDEQNKSVLEPDTEGTGL